MERDRNDGKGCKVVERDGSVGKEWKGIEMMARDGKGCQVEESDGKGWKVPTKQLKVFLSRGIFPRTGIFL